MLKLCNKSGGKEPFRGITLFEFILHETFIKAEAILSVYEQVLKNTNQCWWTFQNGKLISKWKVKSDVNFE